MDPSWVIALYGDRISRETGPEPVDRINAWWRRMKKGALNEIMPPSFPATENLPSDYPTDIHPQTTIVSKNTVRISSPSDIITNLKEYSNQEIAQQEEKSWPFSKFDTGMFLDSRVLDLIDIDALRMLTCNYLGPIVEHVQASQVGRFRYISLMEHQGSFIQYLQYRNLDATGFAATHQVGNRMNELNLKHLNMLRLMSIDVADLLFEWENVVNITRQQEVLGVDLVVAATSIPDDFSWFEYVIVEVLIAIKTLQPRGKMICRFLDINSPRVAEFLYLLSMTFKCLIVIRPITVLGSRAEFYLIAEDLRQEGVEVVSTILINSLNDFIKSQNVTNETIGGFIEEKIPKSFTDWFEGIKADLNRLRFESLMVVKQCLSRRECSPPPMYDFRQLQLFWNIPFRNFLRLDKLVKLTRITTTSDITKQEQSTGRFRQPIRPRPGHTREVSRRF